MVSGIKGNFPALAPRHSLDTHTRQVATRPVRCSCALMAIPERVLGPSIATYRTRVHIINGVVLALGLDRKLLSLLQSEATRRGQIGKKKTLSNDPTIEEGEIEIHPLKV